MSDAPPPTESPLRSTLAALRPILLRGALLGIAIYAVYLGIAWFGI